MVFTYKSNDEDTERKRKVLASEHVIPPSFIPFICKYGLLTKHWDQCGFTCCEWRKPNSSYYKPKRYLLEGYEETHRMKERLKKLTPGPQDPGPSGGLCSRNHMVKLTAARFLSPSFPFPNPRPVFSHLLILLQGQSSRRECLSGSLISCHPLASRKQSALNLHKGPGRKTCSQRRWGSCFEKMEKRLLFAPLYHHDPSPGSKSLNILPRLVVPLL